MSRDVRGRLVGIAEILDPTNGPGDSFVIEVPPGAGEGVLIGTWVTVTLPEGT